VRLERPAPISLVCMHLSSALSDLMFVADFANSIPFAHFDRTARAPRYSAERILPAAGLIISERVIIFWRGRTSTQCARERVGLECTDNAP